MPVRRKQFKTTFPKLPVHPVIKRTLYLNSDILTFTKEATGLASMWCFYFNSERSMAKKSSDE